MNEKFPINTIVTSEKPKFNFRVFLANLFLKEQLGGIAGFIFLLATSIFFSFIIAQFGFLSGVFILLTLVGLPIIYGLIFYPKFGILFYLFLAYVIMYVGKFGIDFPLGTVMDGMIVLLILGLFIQKKRKKEWSIFKGPISVVILVWIIYNLLEVINPAAESRLAWVYTVRTVAVIMVVYFIFIYNIRTKELVVLILKLWLILSFLAALYGLKQQFIGFTGFEEKYLNSDPNIKQLLFIGGQWRKFSIFTDPVAFSYNMVVSSLLCFGLMTGPIQSYKKFLLGICAATCLFSMLYSGTRGAYVLPPAAMVMFAILRFSKKVFFMGIFGALFMAIIIFMPSSNQAINRFQSAFKPSEDASFNVRKANQKRIQPYILSHPMGGGLGATGMWGKRFAPQSFLASFPPDSGYVRVAVEMGWIGLLLFCILMFTILRVGIINYYEVKDPSLKSYSLSMVLIVFAFNIGNYPQEAIVQFPSNVYFYLVTALIVIVKRIDDQQQNETNFNKLAI